MKKDMETHQDDIASSVKRLRLRLQAVAVWLGFGGPGWQPGKVATIHIKFSHILTIYTQTERKIGSLLKKKNYLLYFKKLFFYLNC